MISPKNSWAYFSTYITNTTSLQSSSATYSAISTEFNHSCKIFFYSLSHDDSGCIASETPIRARFSYCIDQWRLLSDRSRLNKKFPFARIPPLLFCPWKMNTIKYKESSASKINASLRKYGQWKEHDKTTPMTTLNGKRSDKLLRSIRFHMRSLETRSLMP